MITAVIGGRTVVRARDAWVDLSDASARALPADPMDALAVWPSVTAWYADHRDFDGPAVEGQLDAVVPRPSQIFCIGLNYRLHALESSLPVPTVPLVFTKFASAVTGPSGVVRIPTPQTDWEVEVAVVIGKSAARVTRDDAWSYVAGVTAAQDFSARDVQMSPAGTPQFSLGKSFAGFLPLGPVLVTPDELEDRDAIPLWCEIDGERVQDGRTDDLIFPIPVLVEYLSSVAVLFPGDVILTGTPSGVGIGSNPPRFLHAGQVVVTGVGGVGTMRHEMAASDKPWAWSP